MPVLSNARHERFAQELAKGKTADEAYGLAGFKPNRGNAATLKAKQSVIDRVSELQERGAEKAAVTVESLVAELEEARALAGKIEQPGAAVQATIGKARLLGLIVDKKEDVTPRRSAEQIDARIRQLLADRGEGRTAEPVGGAGTDASGDAAVPTVPGHGTA